MAFSAIAVRIMIASPIDVSEERVIAADVISEWNAIHSANRGVVLMPIMWETHASAQFGRPAQEDINEHLTDLADIVVGIFWGRVGTPTAGHRSGSIEEVSRHSGAGRPTMLYFSAAAIPNNADLEQVRAVRELREQYQKNGTIWTYKDVEEFRNMFARHLAIELERSKFSIEARNAKPINEVTEVVLSLDASSLLNAIVKDRSGMAMVMRSQGITMVRTSNIALSDGTIRSGARWFAAVEELVHRGFITDRTGSGQTFQVTHAGYSYFDMHSAKTS